MVRSADVVRMEEYACTSRTRKSEVSVEPRHERRYSALALASTPEIAG
jgi:hypothetical protein